MYKGKNYIVTDYIYDETTFFKNYYLQSYTKYKYYARKNIKNDILLNAEKSICKKNNGKILEEENGKIIIEYNSKYYHSVNSIDLRFISNVKRMIIYYPIPDDNLTNKFINSIEKENEEYDFLFSKIR